MTERIIFFIFIVSDNLDNMSPLIYIIYDGRVLLQLLTRLHA